MEDNLNKEIFWVLKELKKTQTLCKERDFDQEGFALLYKDGILFKEKHDGPDSETQWRIIERLEYDGIIKTEQIKVLGENKDNTGGITIKIIEPKFTNFFNKLVINITRKGFDKEKKELTRNILYIDKDGFFWKEPKKTHCYKMDKEGDRYKIVRFLVDNTGYRQTSEISFLLNEKIKKRVSGDIMKIRKNVTNLIGIKGSDIIEGKKGSGYRINPKYKIKVAL